MEGKENKDLLVQKFTPEFIEHMTDFKDYVIGWGNGNKSFCYLIELGTKEYGEIRGANSSKFGLWRGTYGDDKEIKYRATKKNFGGDVDLAFSKLKIEIARIINKSKTFKEFHEIDSFLSPMFKYKIMYIYNSKMMIPIFSLNKIQHFEECLHLKISDTFEDAQKQLMKYKKENKPRCDTYEFMCWLYKNYNKYDAMLTKDVNNIIDNKLNDDLAKLQKNKNNISNENFYGATIKKEKKLLDQWYYPRDIKMAEIALKNANYKCENDNNHKCFMRKSNNLPYTEVHHLIPLAYYYRFEKSLDIPANIVSLCSSCHNEIHYGRDAEKLIKKLYNARKQALCDSGIDIDLTTLLDMYNKLNA